MSKRLETIGMSDTVVQFSISHRDNAPIDYLDLKVFTRCDTGFLCKTTFNCITAKDIDAMCTQLKSLKSNLKYDRRDADGEV